MSPEEKERFRRKPRSFRNTGQNPPIDVEIPTSTSPVLDEDWSPHYINSQEFSGLWNDTKNIECPWPLGIQIHNNKMYYYGKLCVPENLAHKLLWQFHVSSGHIGTQRAIKQAHYNYTFPPTIRISSILESFRKKCKVCQATVIPHYPRL